MQRLGDNIEIITEKAEAKNRYHVGWSWNDFRGKKRLSELRPQWASSNATGRQGTSLLITSLKDSQLWEQAETLERFKVRLSQMISPYAKLPQFKIRGRINNRELELADISDKIRSLAALRYTVDFDGTNMTIAGRMRLDYVRPAIRRSNSDEEQREFDDLVADDDGKAFFEFLSQQRASARFQLDRDGKSGWLCRYGATYSWDQVDKAELVASDYANPGSFHAEVDSFNLEDDERSVFAGSQQYKQYVKNFGA